MIIDPWKSSSVFLKFLLCTFSAASLQFPTDNHSHLCNVYIFICLYSHKMCVGHKGLMSFDLGKQYCVIFHCGSCLTLPGRRFPVYFWRCHPRWFLFLNHHSDAAVNISTHLPYTLLQQFLWNVCVEVSNMHALHRLDSWLQNGRTNLPASRWHRTIHSPHISDSIGITKLSNFCQSRKHKWMSQIF